MIANLLGSVSALALIGASAAFMPPLFARGDVLFTVAGEGKAKAIVLSSDEEGLGELDHFVMTHADHHLNDPRYLTDPAKHHLYDPNFPPWEVLENKDGVSADEYQHRGQYARWTGLHYVGIPAWRHVLLYDFEWSETRTVKSEEGVGTEEIYARKAKTNFIYVKDFPYSLIVDNVLTKDLVTVNALVTVTVRITNPYLALFKTEGWLKQVIAAVDREARDYIGVHSYYELKSESSEGLSPENQVAATPGPLHMKPAQDRSESFSRPIINLTKILHDEDDPEKPIGFKGKYGVTISSVDLRWIRPADENDKALAEAITAPFRAAQQAKATVVLAKADAEATELRGAAEAKTLTQRLEAIAAHGQLGIVFAGYDAMVETSKNPANKLLVWPGSIGSASQPLFAGLAELLKSAGITSLPELQAFIEKNGIEPPK